MNINEYTPMQSEWVMALVFFVVVIIVSLVLAVRLQFRFMEMSNIEEKIALDASEYVHARITSLYRELGRVPTNQLTLMMREYNVAVLPSHQSDYDIITPVCTVHHTSDHVDVRITVGNFRKSNFYPGTVFEPKAPEPVCMVAHD